MSAEYEQLTIPEVDQACREVWWVRGVPTEKRRWLGKKVIGHEIVRDASGYLAEIVSMRSGKIGEINDVNLRCALELADATQAVGPIIEEYGSSSHYVEIVATSEGADSRLLHVSFSGVIEDGIDSFMENLQRAAPGRE